jgi:hypothetical protein
MVGKLQLIDIVGLNEGQEYEAALHLRWLLLKLWPDLAQSRKDSIKIFVGLKSYGYKLEDLDLVLVGRFSDSTVPSTSSTRSIPATASRSSRAKPSCGTPKMFLFRRQKVLICPKSELDRR